MTRLGRVRRSQVLVGDRRWHRILQISLVSRFVWVVCLGSERKKKKKKRDNDLRGTASCGRALELIVKIVSAGEKRRTPMWVDDGDHRRHFCGRRNSSTNPMVADTQIPC